MNVLRSLLSSVAIVCTAVVAMAFPAIKVTYPTPGTYDDRALLENFNIESIAGATFSTTELPYMMDEQGDIVTAYMFKDFMGVIMVKFDPNEFKSNGAWKFYFPAGALTVGGEQNPTTLVGTYTLNDPSLVTGGEWPQITLISSDPANGASLAAVGAESINKISFKTSDNSAVNYIGWTLYDVTAGEEKDENGEYANAIYLRQGNENRIDLNRNGNNDDTWAGKDPFINIGGANQELVKDHKYAMVLTFAGIGYDPATNQYPRPDQIEMSTLLNTTIYYYGLTKATEYSPYVVESVSPDPETYEIEDATQGLFTVTYSGPVKPTEFSYPLGAGTGTASAGSFEPVGEANAGGYASKWEFTLSSTALAAAVGRLHVNIKASDADGLPVKGNGGYEDGQNDFIYSIDWMANVGAPSVVAVSPLANAEVTELSSITVTNSDNATISYGYVGVATISDKVGNTVRTLGEPECSGKNATWTFDAITAPGEYALLVPSGYFIAGEEQTAASTKSATIVYTIVDNGSGTVTYNLTPATVDPADNSTVESLSQVILKFSDATFCNLDAGATGTLYKVEGTERAELETITASENDFFEPTEYTYHFDEAYTAAGTYEFVIPRATYFDGTYDEQQGASGRACPELVYTYTIGNGGGGEDPVEKGEIVPTVTPENGATVSKLDKVSLKFDETVLYAWDDFSKSYKATLYKVGADGNTEVAAVEPSVDSFFETTEFIYTFNVTEAGTYNFVLPKGTIESKDGSKATPELNYFFTVEGGQQSEAVADLMYAAVDPANGSTFTSFPKIKLTYDAVAYNDFIKGTYCEVYLLDGENETLVTTGYGMENDFAAPTEYTFTIGAQMPDDDEATLGAGTYKVVIPAGLIFDAEYKSSNGAAGHYNPEYVLTYILSSPDSITAIFGENAELNVYGINGIVIKKNASAADFNSLPAGLYIVNGKKVIKK